MEKVELEKVPIGKRVWNYFNFKNEMKKKISNQVEVIESTSGELKCCVCQWMWFWMEQTMGKKELVSVRVKGGNDINILILK